MAVSIDGTNGITSSGSLYSNGGLLVENSPTQYSIDAYKTTGPISLKVATGGTTGTDISESIYQAGTSYLTFKAHGDNKAFIHASLGGASSTGLEIGTTSNDSISFIVNSTITAATINSGGSFYARGNVFIGAGISSTSGLTGGGALQVKRDDTTRIIATESFSTATQYHITFSNNVSTLVGWVACSSTATSYNTASDYRLKENISPITNGLNSVLQLNPVNFTWKSNGEATHGFIAHEVQSVCPEAVTGQKDAIDENGNPLYQGIDSSFLISILTAAIKEQQVSIEDLKNRIIALEAV